MRAMLYAAANDIRVTDTPEPVVAEDEVLVHVRAAGICASELEGFASGDPMRTPPLIMGHEFTGIRADTEELVAVNPLSSCGRCDRCRSGESNICPGRAILGIHRPGGFAERIAVPESACYRLPDGISPSQGALAEPLAGAVHAVALAHRLAGEPCRVAVIGAGAVGVLLTLCLLDRPHVQVCVVEPLDERRRVVEGLGARGVGVASGESDFDVVFDAVGSVETRRASVAMLRRGGLAVWIGLGATPSGFDASTFIREEKRVVGSSCYTDEDFGIAVAMVPRTSPSWVAAVRLDDGADAFRALLRGPAASSLRTALVPTGRSHT